MDATAAATEATFHVAADAEEEEADGKREALENEPFVLLLLAPPPPTLLPPRPDAPASRLDNPDVCVCV